MGKKHYNTGVNASDGSTIVKKVINGKVYYMEVFKPGSQKHP